MYNILPRNCFSYIFEFQLVGMEDIFPKNAFQEGGVGGTNFAGKIYMEIVQHGATNDQIIPRGKEFHKIHFPVM